MIVPFISSTPPEVVLNEKVAKADFLPATRYRLSIVNTTSVTWPPMTPEAMPTDTATSALVEITTPVLLPPVALPMVRPVTVTTTEELAASVADAVVMTKQEVLRTVTTPVLPPLIAKAGGAEVEKKPGGNPRVIRLPAARAPTAVGVKENSAATPVLPATRSSIEIRNVTEHTDAGKHICPLETPLDKMESTLVETATPDEFPKVTSPMVKPESVTVMVALAAIVAPEVVMTMDVAPAALIGAKLAALKETVPVTWAEETKKPVGYVSVILLPAPRAPPAVSLKANVAATPVFLATRLKEAMLNEVKMTAPAITPEGIRADSV